MFNEMEMCKVVIDICRHLSFFFIAMGKPQEKCLIGGNCDESFSEIKELVSDFSPNLFYSQK